MSVHVEDDRERTSDSQIPRLDFELTDACDHRCGHCYNVWTADEGDPNASFPTGRPLQTPDFKGLMSKAVDQSGAWHLTITGGEPMVRRDAMDIIEHACAIASSVTLITNGSHITPHVAAKFAEWGLDNVQLTLLAGDRDTHNALKGAVCFDDTVRSALYLSDAGVRVQCCYVAMKANEDQFEPVMELCAALGIRSISYNRMSPTGRAIHHIARLMPTIDQIEADLDFAEKHGPAWGLSVATAMPIPPCLVDIHQYEWVRFGFCSTGSSSPNIVIDARGNVRSCNLSSGVLGNLLDDDWATVFANPYPRTFKATVPDMCRGCAYETSCQGGCKESGFATFGSHTHPEPLLWLGSDPSRLEALTADVTQKAPPKMKRGADTSHGRTRTDHES